MDQKSIIVGLVITVKSRQHFFASASPAACGFPSGKSTEGSRTVCEFRSKISWAPVTASLTLPEITGSKTGR